MIGIDRPLAALALGKAPVMPVLTSVTLPLPLSAAGTPTSAAPLVLKVAVVPWSYTLLAVMPETVRALVVMFAVVAGCVTV